MSIGTIPDVPVQTEDTFDRDWRSAQAGTLAPPTSVVGEPAPQLPADASPGQTPSPVATPGNDAAPTGVPPQTFAWPSDLEPELRNLPAELRSDPRALVRAARSFLSFQGNAPQIEEQWRQAHVGPVQERLTAAEQELATLREERRQALDNLVRVDPQTGRQRTPEEQNYVRAQLQAAQQDQDRTAQERERQQQLDQREQVLTQRESRLNQQGDAATRLLALNSLSPYVQRLSQHTGVPVAELQQYVKGNQFEERLQRMADLSHWGGLVQGLTDYATMRGPMIAAETAKANGARYRDLGNGSATGTGGGSSADRWTKANDADFDSAWERAKRGELI